MRIAECFTNSGKRFLLEKLFGNEPSAHEYVNTVLAAKQMATAPASS
jgi:hypothetical protein